MKSRDFEDFDNNRGKKASSRVLYAGVDQADEEIGKALSIITGPEVLRADLFRPLDVQRVGPMTNPSAVDRDLRSAYEIFTTM